MARLLVSVLDSLCQPGVDLVQCLPLFPRALSNLASVASPNLDASMTQFRDTFYFEIYAFYWKIPAAKINI